MARYKQLAEKFIHDIELGRLMPGDRMLSLRQFALQHRISVSTAVSCYDELESQGWLVSRPQSGFYIAKPPSFVPSPTWSSFPAEVITPAIIRPQSLTPCGSLGTARIQLDHRSTQALERSFQRAIKRVANRVTYYPEQQGEPVLLNALAEHFSQQGFPIHGDELVITYGCMDAVKTALLVTSQPGDTVAVSSPCYNGLLDLLSQLGLKIIEIPSLKDGIDLEQFEMHLKNGDVQTALFCTTHMNPQGITLSDLQKQRLAKLANDYRIPIIEDDVYLELSHRHQPPLPAAYYDDGGYILWCGSVSKSISPSHRLGWCRPGRFFQQYVKRGLGVPTLIQYAIAEFIDSGVYAKHLKRVRTQLSQNKSFYLGYLSHHLPLGTRITQPDGGLVLWIQIPGLDANALGEDAKKAKLDIRIGPWFTESDRYQDSLRLNIGCAVDEAIERELKTLVELINKHGLS